MEFVLTHPDVMLGVSYYCKPGANGSWYIVNRPTARQSLPFDMTEVRQYIGQTYQITGYRLQGHYSQSKRGGWARAGWLGGNDDARPQVAFGADFDVNPGNPSGSALEAYPPILKGELDYEPSFNVVQTEAEQRATVVVSGIRLVVEVDAIATKCSPPTSASLDKWIAEGSATLSWSGASGGTNNAIDHYEYQYQDSPNGVDSWGSWSGSVVSNGNFATVTTNPARGAYRRFRIRAVGVAGDGYASDWYTMIGLLRTNTLPGRPGTITAPAVVVQSGTASISWGASAPGLSAVAGYLIEGLKEGGQWQSLTAQPVAGTSADVSTLNAVRGSLITYRVCAVDVLGAKSSWTISPAIRVNRLPPAPEILWPLENGQCLAAQPIIGLRIQPDPDGQPMTIETKVGGSGWTGGVAVPAEGSARFAVRLPSGLNVNNNPTVQFRLRDSLGELSAVGRVKIKRVAPGWTRTISRGTVISDTAERTGGSSISHIADLENLLAVVNARLAWFNQPEISYELELGYFKNWLPQMQQLWSSLAYLYSLGGETAPALEQKGSNGPCAATINLIRGMCENL